MKMGFSPPISGAWEDYIYAYVQTIQAFRSEYLPIRASRV